MRLQWCVHHSTTIHRAFFSALEYGMCTVCTPFWILYSKTICSSKCKIARHVNQMWPREKNPMNKLKCDYYLSYLIDFETDTCAHKFMHQTKPFPPHFLLDGFIKKTTIELNEEKWYKKWRVSYMNGEYEKLWSIGNYNEVFTCAYADLYQTKVA